MKPLNFKRVNTVFGGNDGCTQALPGYTYAGIALFKLELDPQELKMVESLRQAGGGFVGVAYYHLGDRLMLPVRISISEPEDGPTENCLVEQAYKWVLNAHANERLDGGFSLTSKVQLFDAIELQNLLTQGYIWVALAINSAQLAPIYYTLKVYSY